MSLLVERKNRILHINLSRPAKRNALTVDMSREIVRNVRAVQDDPRIGCVLITGAGQVFCSGIDLDEMAVGNSHVFEALFQMGAEALKPIVVAVNGAALGGGLGLVAQGHIVVAEQSSFFSLPEIKVGLWPFLVYRAVEEELGSRRTLALSLSGRTFSAENALAWGLVDQLCPDDEVRDRAEAMARDLARACPSAIEAGMRYARDSRDKAVADAGEMASALQDKLLASADLDEGCAAFKQRREAHWPSMPHDFYGNGKTDGVSADSRQRR